MQVYLGSLYVNDFNRFGRTYSVRVQADAPYRARADDIGLLDGVPEEIARYFDWSAWTRDLAMDYSVYDDPEGGVFVFRDL